MAVSRLDVFIRSVSFFLRRGRLYAVLRVLQITQKGGGIPYFWGIDFEDVLEFAAEEVQAEDWTEG